MHQKIVVLKPRLCGSSWKMCCIPFFLFLVPQAPAPASSLNTESEAIQADYVQMNAAFAQHNLKDVMCYFDPQFKAITPQGQIQTLAQVRHQYQQQMSQMKTMHSQYKVLSCASTPAGVAIEINVHTDGTGQQHFLFARINGSFTNDLCVRDVWVKSSHGWLLTHRQIIKDVTHIYPS